MEVRDRTEEGRRQKQERDRTETLRETMKEKEIHRR